MQVDGEVSSTSGSRKVGWDTGGDSLYSRQGGLTGPQVGTAHRTDFAIDSVGIIIADLNRDTMLDAYVSDLGDNEVPLRRDSRFEPTHDTGAASTASPSLTRTPISWPSNRPQRWQIVGRLLEGDIDATSDGSNRTIDRPYLNLEGPLGNGNDQLIPIISDSDMGSEK
jgi:hypothetical protein